MESWKVLRMIGNNFLLYSTGVVEWVAKNKYPSLNGFELFDTQETQAEARNLIDRFTITGILMKWKKIETFQNRMFTGYEK